MSTLYRPVGPEEFLLIKKSKYKKFPPRLPEQPIFYPVLTEEYAIKIARDWNVKASGIGYVLKFDVDDNYLNKYSIEMAGGNSHKEYWIPSEDLDNFNNAIIGNIKVIHTFQKWYVYIVRCEKDDSLYTGITNNIEKRINKHNNRTGAKYTKNRGPVTLLKSFEMPDKSSALKLEYKIKQLSRKQKLWLIMDIKERAIAFLEQTHKTPRMFCFTKEGLLMRVTTTLDLAGIEFNGINFYKKYLELQGSAFKGLSDSFDDLWARKIIDEALEMIKNG